MKTNLKQIKIVEGKLFLMLAWNVPLSNALSAFDPSIEKSRQIPVRTDV